jgi:hypothetical protein
VGQSFLYALGDLVLELQAEEPRREELDSLLQELSWVRSDGSVCNRTLHLSVSCRNGGLSIPQNVRQVFQADGFFGLEAADDFYLTDGSSLFYLQPAKGEGYARLATSFFHKRSLLQANFWCFGLLKLLRPLGVYSLHGAGLATHDGLGLLLVGPSGTGKSTLAIGLVREGWGYLSDDAVLLRLEPEGVNALACRKSFYIDAACSPRYSDFSLSGAVPDNRGGQRRRIAIEEAYPTQYLSQCSPHLVIFPQITHQNQSTLVPHEDVRSLGVLLTQSAPQLFDRRTMAGQLELLKRLLRQSATYELKAGIDLYHDPAKLIGLIKEAQGEQSWRVSSSN